MPISENFISQSRSIYGPNFSSYLSTQPQWVYDSSIPNAFVPSGLYINSQFLPNNTSGLTIDYIHGQALFNPPTYATISGQYCAKEINIYPTTEREEVILFEKKNFINPRNLPNWTGRHPGDVITPCIFVKTNVGTNTTKAFNGLTDTEVVARLVLISDNNYLFKGATSLFRDSQETFFPLLSLANLPFDPYGNLKNGIFNYSNLQNAANPNDMIFVKHVAVSPFDDFTNSLIAQNCKGGFIDITLSNWRFPKDYTLY